VQLLDILNVGAQNYNILSVQNYTIEIKLGKIF